MKVLLISSSDSGGAGKACLRLHQSLIDIGVDSSMLVSLQHHYNIKNLYSISDFYRQKFLANYRMRAKIGYYYLLNKAMIAGRPKIFEIFSSPSSLIDLKNNPLFLDADIINLHWVSYLLDYKNFFNDLSKPVVWTLHDMNPFSGGCHVSMGCDGFKSCCHGCPQTDGNLFENYAENNLSSKIEAMRNVQNLTVITPSEWLGSQSASSMLMKSYPHYVINNGIDSSKYKIIPREQARKALSLPNDKIIMFFVSDMKFRWYKGFEFLKEAVNKSHHYNKIMILTIGSELKNTKDLKCPIVQLGYVRDDNKVMNAYSAADVCVTPSLADNFPNTIIESFFCGTPVIGYPSGGITELIDEPNNGLLCKSPEMESLIKAIDKFVEIKDAFYREEIRNNAVGRYDVKLMAENYLKLYRKVLNG